MTKEKLTLWTTFFRRNPHRFAEYYLGIQLFPYQSLALWAMMRSPTSVFIGARATAKSFLTALCAVIRAILWPGSEIIVAAPTRGQSRLLVAGKIKDELMAMSPTLALEIESAKTSGDEAEIRFRNGSVIKSVTAGESARGNRCSYLIIDECRMVDRQTLDRVLTPFLTVRRAPYLAKAEYERLAEEPKLSLVSSAWFRSHWLYEEVLAAARGMIRRPDGGSETDSALLAADWRATVRHGIRTPRQIESERERTDPSTWALEYENAFPSGDGTAYFSRSLFESARADFTPFPRPESGRVPGKAPGELRIMGCDLAFVAREGNDSTAVALLCIVPSEDGRYERRFCYAESFVGGDSARQAARIRELYDALGADRIALDTRGGGVTVYDLLARPLFAGGRMLPPLRCTNDAATAARVPETEGAINSLYAVNATARLNGEIASGFRAAIASGRLLLPSRECEPETEAVSGEIDAAVGEACALACEYSELTGVLRVTEPSGGHKDRYSAVSYANYLADLVERESAGDRSGFGYVAMFN